MFNKVTVTFNRTLMAIAGIFLVSMILLTCGNIFLRIVWVPIRGTFELMGFFGAIVTSFALGHTQIRKGHIAVDVLVRRFSPRIIRFLDGVNHLACVLFFTIVAWQLGAKGNVLFRTGEVTETLRIIYHPFIYGTAVGCGFLSLVLAGRLLEWTPRGKGDPA